MAHWSNMSRVLLTRGPGVQARRRDLEDARGRTAASNLARVGSTPIDDFSVRFK